MTFFFFFCVQSGRLRGRGCKWIRSEHRRVRWWASWRACVLFGGKTRAHGWASRECTCMRVRIDVCVRAFNKQRTWVQGGIGEYSSRERRDKRYKGGEEFLLSQIFQFPSVAEVNPLRQLSLLPSSTFLWAKCDFIRVYARLSLPFSTLRGSDKHSTRWRSNRDVTVVFFFVDFFCSRVKIGWEARAFRAKENTEIITGAGEEEGSLFDSLTVISARRLLFWSTEAAANLSASPQPFEMRGKRREVAPDCYGKHDYAAVWTTHIHL